jgi:hypothetical protein
VTERPKRRQQSEKVAIGYVRVSTDYQAREGVSLDAQRDTLFKLCEFRRALSILKLPVVVTRALRQQ